MNKLEKLDTKDNRAQLLELAKVAGIGIVHVHNVKGGITVAFRPATQYKNCYMVNVAVHTCSVNDTFSRKIGILGALDKFANGETIQLPLLNMFSQEDVAFAVKRAFTAMYEAVSP